MRGDDVDIGVHAIGATPDAGDYVSELRNAGRRVDWEW
jgi:hypothetical protein